ncbi:haloacid dehalogenase, partial [Kouleothrix aurantiaca]
ITTIVLSLGMQRMAGRNVIVRKLAAVETLGSTTVICSDKTGTLTKNEMTVRTVATAGGRVDFTGIGYEPAGEVQQGGAAVSNPALLEEVAKLLRAAGLSNNATLIEQDGRWSIQGDPTEGALLVAARKVGLARAELDQRFPRIGEVPFSSERKLMSTAHNDRAHDNRVVVFAKGAPDVLLARCTHERVGETSVPLSDERRAAIGARIEQLAADALRTLGVAFRTLPGNAAGGGLGEEIEQELVLLGIIGMIDPPRPEARQAVAEAQGAGIRAIMITGDHPITAAAIAAELGIVAAGVPAITGGELQRLDDAGMQAALARSSVFARVAPEHKLQLVRALKRNGEITAMTGDGVNDAPALKAADIGVAMGITGTDVSKGAADMMLTEDN